MRYQDFINLLTRSGMGVGGYRSEGIGRVDELIARIDHHLDQFSQSRSQAESEFLRGYECIDRAESYTIGVFSDAKRCFENAARCDTQYTKYVSYTSSIIQCIMDCNKLKNDAQLLDSADKVTEAAAKYNEISSKFGSVYNTLFSGIGGDVNKFMSLMPQRTLTETNVRSLDDDRNDESRVGGSSTFFNTRTQGRRESDNQSVTSDVFTPMTTFDHQRLFG